MYGSRCRIINDHKGELLPKLHRLAGQVLARMSDPGHSAQKIHRLAQAIEDMSRQMTAALAQKIDFDDIKVLLGLRRVQGGIASLNLLSLDFIEFGVDAIKHRFTLHQVPPTCGFQPLGDLLAIGFPVLDCYFHIIDG